MDEDPTIVMPDPIKKEKPIDIDRFYIFRGDDILVYDNIAGRFIDLPSRPTRDIGDVVIYPIEQ